MSEFADAHARTLLTYSDRLADEIQLAAGVGLEDGQFLPPGWRPFSAHRWLAEYLTAHQPQLPQLEQQLQQCEAQQQQQ
jgi:hypothetical protein